MADVTGMDVSVASEVVDRTDAFPKRLFNWIPKETEYNFQELRDIYSRRDIHPFIFYVDNDKVYFKLLKDSWSQKRLDNLKRLAKDAGGCRGDRVKSWDSKVTALKNVAAIGGNNYCDRRLSYVFDRHYFLVKSAFTFGQRTVLEDTVHLYQVTQVPLQLYIMPKSGMRRNHRLKVIEKLLAVDEQRYYDHHELRANTVYRLKPGTRYVLFASQKCFFSVHVLPESMQLPFRTTDPLEEWQQQRRLRREATIAAATAYDRPPSTPYMLDESLAEQHEFRVPPPPPPSSSSSQQRQRPRVEEQQQQQPEEDSPPAYESLFPGRESPPYGNLEQQRQPPPPEPSPISVAASPPDRQQQQLEPPAVEDDEESRWQQREQQQQQQQLMSSSTILFAYAMERQINVVHPDMVKWYHALKKKYGAPDHLVEPNLLQAGRFQTEPVDLTVTGPTAATMTPESLTQDMDTTTLTREEDPTADFDELLEESPQTLQLFQQLLKELETSITSNM